MKVATIAKLTPRKLGGFEREMLLLTRELASRGDEHLLFFEEDCPAWYKKQLEKAGASAASLFARGVGAWDLAGLVKREKPDLAHLHFFRVFGPLGAALKLRGIPKVVITEHMGLAVPKRSRLGTAAIRLRARALQPFADKIICVSDYVKQRLLVSDYAAQNRLVVIFNGVDLDHHVSPEEQASCRLALGLEEKTRVACAVAYATPGKGVEIYMQAASRLATTSGKYAFLHVGDGPLLEGLAEKAQKMGLTNFRFLGHQKDVRAWLALADIVVVPSDGPEGAPFTAMEAMAEGKPVVATAVGGTPEVVVEGETGKLVPPGDIQALAEAMLQLLEDTALARRLGAAGRKRAEQKFNLPRKIEETIALYEGLASAK